jgi:short-subunit dehydrogenase
MTDSEQAVVVGATGTIGQAVIRRLTRRGLPVVAVARSKDALDELAASHELITPCPGRDRLRAGAGRGRHPVR